MVAVISPWNFPVAICCGMTSAALATGNAVVVKPAEQSPGCGLMVVQALREAGVPPDALALLPGEGDVGAALVADPRVHTIAFTGSGQVGLEIVRTAADVPAGQNHLKRVIAEMGGKNCVIVDADADLDDVVPDLVYSAYGYAGQKCSAASRVLCHEAVHDHLVERLAGRVRDLRVGQAEALDVDVPAVIERAAQERIQGYVGAGARRRADRRAGRAARRRRLVRRPDRRDRPAGRLAGRAGGDLRAGARPSSACPASQEACDRVDASSYALTGGLFARNPETVDYVAARTPVGNLYVNRNITGAMVGRQPFGGNRLSGTGTKAGGPGYLLQFVEPRVVTENTMRHGLVV